MDTATLQVIYSRTSEAHNTALALFLLPLQPMSFILNDIHLEDGTFNNVSGNMNQVFNSPSGSSTHHHSDSHGNRVLLPIPTWSNNESQVSFTFSEVDVDNSLRDPLDVPSEIGAADLAIAREHLLSC